MNLDIVACRYFHCRKNINKNDVYNPAKPFPSWNNRSNYAFCSKRCFDDECNSSKHFCCSFCDKNLLFSPEKLIYHSYESLDMYFCNEKCENAYPEVNCYVCKKKRYWLDKNWNSIYFVNGDACDIGKDICNLCYEERYPKFICNVCNEYIRISNGLVIKNKKNMCNNCAEKEEEE